MEIRALIMCLLIARKDTQKPIRESRAQFLPSSVLWVWWGDKPLSSCWDLYLHFLGLSEKQMLGQITKDEAEEPVWPPGCWWAQETTTPFDLVWSGQKDKSKIQTEFTISNILQLVAQNPASISFFPSKTCWYCFHCFWLKQRLELEQRRPTTKTEDCCWKVLLRLKQEVFQSQPGIDLKNPNKRQCDELL